MPVRETVTIRFDGDAASFLAQNELVQQALQETERQVNQTSQAIVQSQRRQADLGDSIIRRQQAQTQALQNLLAVQQKNFERLGVLQEARLRQNQELLTQEAELLRISREQLLVDEQRAEVQGQLNNRLEEFAARQADINRVFIRSPGPRQELSRGGLDFDSLERSTIQTINAAEGLKRSLGGIPGEVDRSTRAVDFLYNAVSRIDDQLPRTLDNARHAAGDLQRSFEEIDRHGIPGFAAEDLDQLTRRHEHLDRLARRSIEHRNFLTRQYDDLIRQSGQFTQDRQRDLELVETLFESINRLDAEIPGLLHDSSRATLDFQNAIDSLDRAEPGRISAEDLERLNREHQRLASLVERSIERRDILIRQYRQLVALSDQLTEGRERDLVLTRQFSEGIDIASRSLRNALYATRDLAGQLFRVYIITGLIWALLVSFETVVGIIGAVGVAFGAFATIRYLEDLKRLRSELDLSSESAQRFVAANRGVGLSIDETHRAALAIREGIRRGITDPLSDEARELRLLNLRFREGDLEGRNLIRTVVALDEALSHLSESDAAARIATITQESREAQQLLSRGNLGERFDSTVGLRILTRDDEGRIQRLQERFGESFSRLYSEMRGFIADNARAITSIIAQVEQFLLPIIATVFGYLTRYIAGLDQNLPNIFQWIRDIYPKVLETIDRVILWLERFAAVFRIFGLSGPQVVDVFAVLSIVTLLAGVLAPLVSLLRSIRFLFAGISQALKSLEGPLNRFGNFLRQHGLNIVNILSQGSARLLGLVTGGSLIGGGLVTQAAASERADAQERARRDYDYRIRYGDGSLESERAAAARTRRGNEALAAYWSQIDSLQEANTQSIQELVRRLHGTGGTVDLDNAATLVEESQASIASVVRQQTALDSIRQQTDSLRVQARTQAEGERLRAQAEAEQLRAESNQRSRERVGLDLVRQQADSLRTQATEEREQAQAEAARVRRRTESREILDYLGRGDEQLRQQLHQELIDSITRTIHIFDVPETNRDLQQEILDSLTRTIHIFDVPDTTRADISNQLDQSIRDAAHVVQDSIVPRLPPGAQNQLSRALEQSLSQLSQAAIDTVSQTSQEVRQVSQLIQGTSAQLRPPFHQGQVLETTEERLARLRRATQYPFQPALENTLQVDFGRIIEDVLTAGTIAGALEFAGRKILQRSLLGLLFGGPYGLAVGGGLTAIEAYRALSIQPKLEPIDQRIAELRIDQRIAELRRIEQAVSDDPSIARDLRRLPPPYGDTGLYLSGGTFALLPDAQRFQDLRAQVQTGLEAVRQVQSFEDAVARIGFVTSDTRPEIEQFIERLSRMRSVQDLVNNDLVRAEQYTLATNKTIGELIELRARELGITSEQLKAESELTAKRRQNLIERTTAESLGARQDLVAASVLTFDDRLARAGIDRAYLEELNRRNARQALAVSRGADPDERFLNEILDLEFRFGASLREILRLYRAELLREESESLRRREAATRQHFANQRQTARRNDEERRRLLELDYRRNSARLAQQARLARGEEVLFRAGPARVDGRTVQLEQLILERERDEQAIERLRAIRLDLDGALRSGLFQDPLGREAIGQVQNERLRELLRGSQALSRAMNNLSPAQVAAVRAELDRLSHRELEEMILQFERGRETQLRWSATFQGTIREINTALFDMIFRLGEADQIMRRLALSVGRNIFNTATEGLFENIFESVNREAERSATARFFSSLLSSAANRQAGAGKRTAPLVEQHVTINGDANPNQVRQSVYRGGRDAIREGLSTQGGQEILRQHLEEE